MSFVAFVNPILLWALVSIFPAALLFYLLEKIRVKRIKLVSNIHSNINTSFRIYSLLPLIIIFALILALARPFHGSKDIEVPAASNDILILLDVSKSMLATDLKPSRLEFAKRKFRDIVQFVSNQINSSRIGIVLFSGESYLYCPLTEDYAVLEYFIKSISTDLITSQGTAIFDAITTAAKSLEEVKAKDPFVILISDGEDNFLETSAVIELANKTGIKINVLSTGTVEGSPIPEAYGGFLKDKQGNIVISKLAEDTLRTIAEKTGGVYSSVTASNTDINQIFNSISIKSRSSTAKKKYTVYNEKAHYLLIFILLTSFILIFAGKESLIFILLLYSPLTANADEDEVLLSLNNAYHAYQNGDYKNAENSFKYYYENDPKNLDIAQSYASVLYKLGKFKEAKSIFEKVYNTSSEGKRKFEAHFNAGNTNYMLQDYETSIKEFKEALKINPEDSNTIHNLQLVKKRLEEIKSRPTPTPTPVPTQSKNNNEDNENQKNDNQEKPEENNNDKSEDPKDNQEQVAPENEDENTQDKNEANQNSEREENKDEGKKPSDSSKEQDTETQNENYQSENKEVSGEEMKESEAKAWLESLPDSPVLLRRKVSKSPSRSRQQW